MGQGEMFQRLIDILELLFGERGIQQFLDILENLFGERGCIAKTKNNLR